MPVAALDVNLVVDKLPAGTRDLDEKLAARGASAGWVTAAAARVGHRAADDTLAPVAAQTARVQHLPVVMPPTGLNGEVRRAIAIAESAELRVVRVCPGAQHFPLVSWVLEPLPELCAAAGLALMVDFAPTAPDWPTLLALAHNHPSLPLVVTGLDASLRLTLPALLDAAPNVIADSGPIDSDRLDRWVAMFGSHRFVWSGPARSAPALETLSDTDRRAVLTGNAALLATGEWAGRWL